MLIRDTLFFLNTEGVFILVGIIVMYFFVIVQERAEAMKILVSVICAGMFSVFLKELFDQPRPFITGSEEPLAGLAYLGSFPSFHTAISFALATNVVYYQKRVGIILIFLAALIGFGRVISNVHYPVDILFGIIIGILIAVAVESLIPLPKSAKRRI